jgi:hypothetical protein
VGVIELQEVLRRFCPGEGLRALARATGIDRKTVKKYVAAGVAVGLCRGGDPPTEAQLPTVLTHLRSSPVGRPPEIGEQLAPHQDQIAAWLAEGLRLTKIYRRLRAQGVRVPYSSLHRFARAQLDLGPSAITVRVADPPPGEAAEIDFGLLGLWLDPLSGQRRRVYGLLVTCASAATRFSGSACARICPPSSTGSRPPGRFLAGSSSGSSRTT